MATYDELLKKASTGKLSTAEKKELADFLFNSAEEEAQKNLQKNLDEVLELIETLGVDKKEVIKALQPQSLIIVRWTDANNLTHEKHEGSRGKSPAWVADFKKLGEAKALEFALNEQGKNWVKTLFSK